MASGSAQARSSELLQPLARGREYGSWGGYPRVFHDAVYRPQWTDEMEALLRRARDGSLLAYGLGRSYGDCCLNQGRSLVDCSRLDRFLAADFREGWIRCEAGASLASILELAVPRGWFLPVTPGTKFVTVGGAIANDVHGKNHHRAGTFGRYVRKMAVYRSDCGLVMCSPEVNGELFRATIGGVGLTGLIAWAEIQLRPIAGAYMAVETIPFHSLDEFLQLTAQSDGTFEYTVAWIDCVSSGAQRGIFFRANHSPREGMAHPRRARLQLPFSLPACTLNRFSVKAFNATYYFSKRHKRGTSILPYDAFFYPLDVVGRWNRVYGKRGFLQYQCVVPQAAMVEVLRLIADSGMGSFLAVLKQFGACSSPGILSFPRPGLTIALDFPMRGHPTLQLFRRLDGVVAEAGGALYPAKDACMTPEMFAASFPQWRQFRTYVDDKLSSSLWRRVTERA